MIIAYFIKETGSATARSKTHIIHNQKVFCNRNIEGAMVVIGNFSEKNMPECGNCRAAWERRKRLFERAAEGNLWRPSGK